MFQVIFTFLVQSTLIAYNLLSILTLEGVVEPFLDLGFVTIPYAREVPQLLPFDMSTLSLFMIS